MNGQMRRIDSASDPDSFQTQEIDPIGTPYGWTVDWDNVTWNFHQFGEYSNVFDPCLRLKQSSPRVPQNEDVNNPYKTDLYDSGDWNLQTAFSLQEVN
jgi:hypothetical protein